MRDYIYTGTARHLSRFGYVTPGSVIALTDDEVRDIAGDDRFKPSPTPTLSRPQVAYTAAHTVAEADDGKTLVYNNTTARIVTLPDDLDPGFETEIVIGTAATEPVTVEPGDVLVAGWPMTGRVHSIAVTDPGTGYTTDPTVAFDPGEGAGAGAAATVDGLTLVSASVADGGSGYKPGDKATLADGTAVGTAKAVAAVATVGLHGATVQAAGSGYAIAEVVTMAGGTTTDAATVAVATAKAVSAAVDTAGTGYVIDEEITLAGGTGTAAVLKVSALGVVAGAVEAGGTGYEVDDELTVVGGTGTAAVLKVATIGEGGVVTGVTIEVAGAYTVAPTDPVAVTGGAGENGEFNLTYGVAAVSVETPGNYSVLPVDPVEQASSSGSGTGAKADVLWGILTVTVANDGEYPVIPTDPVAQGATDGTGAGATLNATWKANSVTVDNGGLYSAIPTNDVAQDGAAVPAGGTGLELTAAWGVGTVTVDDGGTNYDAAPAVAFEGGAGSGAEATAVMLPVSEDKVLTPGTDARLGLRFDGSKWLEW